MMFKRKKRESENEIEVNCFKCGEKIAAHILYCPRCNRQQFLPMEGLERGYNEDIPSFIQLQEKEIEGDPKNYYRHFTLGNSHFLNGDYRGAIHRYKMSLDLKPDFGDAKLNLGFVYKLNGDNKSAEKMLEAFKRESPHSNKVEAAHKLLCEIRGIPWEQKRKTSGKPPEIIKPRSGIEKVNLKKERLNFSTLIFSLMLVLILIFGIVRRDIIISAYDHLLGALGGYITSDAGPVDDEDTDEKSEEGFFARLFSKRDVEEVLKDQDWVEDPIPRYVGGEAGDPDTPEVKPEGSLNVDPMNDSYWPMAVGNHWKYIGWNIDSRGRRVEGSTEIGSIRILSIEKDGEPPLYKVSRFGSTSYYFESEDAIWESNHPERAFSTGVAVLRKPLNVGDREIDRGMGMGYEVIEETEIDTIPGKFKIMRIKTWILDSPNSYTEIFYAKGVGPVRFLSGSETEGFRVYELTAYEVDEEG